MFTKRAQRLSPVFNNNGMLATAGLTAAAKVGGGSIFYHQNDLVWISHEIEAWVPGKVISVVSNSKIIVQGVGEYYNNNITVDLQKSEHSVGNNGNKNSSNSIFYE